VIKSRLSVLTCCLIVLSGCSLGSASKAVVPLAQICASYEFLETQSLELTDSVSEIKQLFITQARKATQADPDSTEASEMYEYSLKFWEWQRISAILSDRLNANTSAIKAGIREPYDLTEERMLRSELGWEPPVKKEIVNLCLSVQKQVTKHNLEVPEGTVLADGLNSYVRAQERKYAVSDEDKALIASAQKTRKEFTSKHGNYDSDLIPYCQSKVPVNADRELFLFNCYNNTVGADF